MSKESTRNQVPLVRAKGGLTQYRLKAYDKRHGTWVNFLMFAPVEDGGRCR
jgi:hypothetical protein